MKLEQILKVALIIQEREVRTPLGPNGWKESRLNPWNPLTYITLLLVAILYGAMEGCKILTEKNHFKWS